KPLDRRAIGCKARNTKHDRVPMEDLGKRLANDRPNAISHEPLRRVLARRSTPEVRIDDQHGGSGVSRVVEGVPSISFAIILEQVVFQPFKGDSSKKTRRHDAIRVDVVSAQRNRSSAYVDDLLPGAAHAGTSSSIVRTSATSPATAAAATIAGLMSNVRPVGLPCRPLKFRFDDEAQICRSWSRSVFIPRHIEQPAPRHSKPALVKTSSSPRASASRAIALEPGTTGALTCGARGGPRTTRAASSRSERRPFVQEPMKATSIRVPRTRAPGLNPMKLSASASASRGIDSPIPTD